MDYVEIPSRLDPDGVWRFASSTITSGKYKLRIPKNTTSWRTGIVTWLTDEESSALMALDGPPNAANAIDMSVDTRLVLQRLWEGATVKTVGIPRCQSLGMSQAELGGVWRSDRERWLYIDVVFTNGVVYNWSNQIVVDMIHAEVPTEVPPVSQLTPLEERARLYLLDSGYVQALKTFGGYGDGEQQDIALVVKSRKCGLIDALLRAIDMAEKYKPKV